MPSLIPIEDTALKKQDSANAKQNTRDNRALLALPLPILTFVLSAVACALVWRLDIGNRLARSLFTGAFALIATSTMLVGLRFGYGIEQFAAIQRVIPLFIGPLVYLGFSALMRPAADMRRLTGVHLAIAGAAAFLPYIIPQLRLGFDLVVGLSYLVYCIALLRLWRKGDDSLVHARLDRTRGLRQWMLCTSAMLAIMLVLDIGIAISFAVQRSEDALALISYGSGLTLIGLIFAVVVLSNVATTKSSAKRPDAVADSSAVELERSARDLLVKSRLYLDTDLTLERLAKRLHVPARALSEAVNQTQNMNVSQYVNGFRLHHAVELLETSDLSVTRVMEQSGFLTRSNFYREFERVYRLSPLEYRKREVKRINGV